MKSPSAFGVLLACAFAGPAAAVPETVGEASPVTVSTSLPSNINSGVPGMSSNPTLNGLPAQNPAPTPAEGRLGTVPTEDAVTQAPPPPQKPPALDGAAAIEVKPAEPAEPTAADLQRGRLVRDALLKSFPRAPGTDGAAATGGIDGLKVTSRNGRVQLRGTVRTRQLKDAAAARAAAVVGGPGNVDDRLVVK
jgi:hypothetical protein